MIWWALELRPEPSEQEAVAECAGPRQWQREDAIVVAERNAERNGAAALEQGGYVEFDDVVDGAWWAVAVRAR